MPCSRAGDARSPFRAADTGENLRTLTFGRFRRCPLLLAISAGLTGDTASPRGIYHADANSRPSSPGTHRNPLSRLRAFSSQHHLVNKTQHANWYLGFAVPGPPSPIQGASMVHRARLWVRLGYSFIGTKLASSIYFIYFIIQNRKKHKNGQDCVYLKSCLKPRLETPCTRRLRTSAVYSIWHSRVLAVIEVSRVTREDTVVLGQNLSKHALISPGFSRLLLCTKSAGFCTEDSAAPGSAVQPMC